MSSKKRKKPLKEKIDLGPFKLDEVESATKKPRKRKKDRFEQIMEQEEYYQDKLPPLHKDKYYQDDLDEEEDEVEKREGWKDGWYDEWGSDKDKEKGKDKGSWDGMDG